MELMYYIVRGLYLGESVQGGGLKRAGGRVATFESTSTHINGRARRDLNSGKKT
jgi:hypothetical protein